MFTADNRRHTAQRLTCLFLAVFIVSSCLTLGAIGAEVMVRQAQAAASATQA